MVSGSDFCIHLKSRVGLARVAASHRVYQSDCIGYFCSKCRRYRCTFYVQSIVCATFAAAAKLAIARIVRSQFRILFLISPAGIQIISPGPFLTFHQREAERSRIAKFSY